MAHPDEARELHVAGIMCFLQRHEMLDQLCVFDEEGDLLFHLSGEPDDTLIRTVVMIYDKAWRDGHECGRSEMARDISKLLAEGQ